MNKLFPVTCSFLEGVAVPMPTLPETYKPLAGGVEPLPIDTPPLLCTKNLVEAFTCTRNGIWPVTLFICTLEEGAVVPKPQSPLLVSLPRSLLLLLNKIEKLVVDPRVPFAESALPLVTQF